MYLLYIGCIKKIINQIILMPYVLQICLVRTKRQTTQCISEFFFLSLLQKSFDPIRRENQNKVCEN